VRGRSWRRPRPSAHRVDVDRPSPGACHLGQSLNRRGPIVHDDGDFVGALVASEFVNSNGNSHGASDRQCSYCWRKVLSPSSGPNVRQDTASRSHAFVFFFKQVRTPRLFGLLSRRRWTTLEGRPHIPGRFRHTKGATMGVECGSSPARWASQTIRRTRGHRRRGQSSMEAVLGFIGRAGQLAAFALAESPPSGLN
jgi:hypothetical protein